MHSLYEKIKDEIILLRRQIHMFPELSFNEFKTADTICSVLDKYKINYERNIAGTGIVAKIGKGQDKVLIIRADMDALPVCEETLLPFSSENDGVMHACGHDIHIASALACAIMLKKNEENLSGCAKIVFQPGEETTGGAEPMINEGILDNPKVTCAIGGHVTSELDVGKIMIKDGALMASPDDFSIVFVGKTTHGATPEYGLNPILPASKMVMECEEIAKDLKDGSVLSVCTIDANGSVNIIPERAKILGTFRSFSEDKRKEISNKLKDISNEIAKTYGVKAEYKYNFLYPPVINDVNTTKGIISAAKDVIGSENVITMPKPVMTGDDFSYFCKYVPSAYFWYGVKDGTDEPLHSSRFVASEDAIEICANVFYKFATDYLK